MSIVFLYFFENSIDFFTVRLYNANEEVQMSDLGNKEIFAKNLQYYMKINNKDRIDVARDLDLPYTTVVSWYKGEFSLSIR